MSEACRRYNIPHLVEISRSGNGAHLWVFFTDAVSTRDARLLGFGLLDKAMEIHPNLSFESYDRLFPNQDIMPEGSFGNLIALPLQKQVRQSGNSQFVDQALEPFTDQWQQLKQITTVSPTLLAELITVLAPDESKLFGQEIIDSRPPWEQGAKIKPEKIDNCSEQVTSRCFAFCIARKTFIFASFGSTSPGMGCVYFSCSVTGLGGLFFSIAIIAFVFNIRVFEKLLHVTRSKSFWLLEIFRANVADVLFGAFDCVGD